MLIWIEGSSADFVPPLSQELVDAFTELGEAGYMGRHAVAGSRQLLQHLAAFDFLSPRAKAYFSRMALEYTQLGHVFSRPRQLTLSASAVAPMRYGQAWTVPLDMFANPEYSRATEVVCENDTDYEILEVFAQVLMKQTLPGCVTASRSRSGGGGSTVTVLRRIFRDPSPLMLCVLDSDKKIVLGAEGSTARGCRAAWVSMWRTQLFVLSCRELENALPRDLVAKFVEESGSDATHVRRLPFVHTDISDYVCLKSGERLCRFHEVPESATGHRRTRTALLWTSQRHPEFSACGAECAECDCDVTPALGDQFLLRFSEWIAKYENRKKIEKHGTWHDDLKTAVGLFVDHSLALPKKV